jgi:Helicase associated domain
MAAREIDRHVAELADFKRQHGHLMMSQRMPRELFHWAAEQRERWRIGQLESALENQLRRIGFPLEVEECEWELVFAGVFRIHQHFRTLPKANSALGVWLDRQQALFKSGALRADREQRLRRIGALGPREGRSSANPSARR